MYCRKCGKWIDYDAETCRECQENDELFKRAEEQSAPQAGQQPVQQDRAPAEETGSRMYGFGLALAAAIVSFFTFWFSYIMIIVTIATVAGNGNRVGCVMLLQFAIGAGIFALVAGISSVKKYSACSNAGKIKPIPALVLGIVSIVLSGLSLFMSFISLTSAL